MSPDMEEAGGLVSAALAASEIDRASIADRRDALHQSKNCDNCGAKLGGAFCEACGQAAHVHRSLLHLTEEVLHGVLHFDAKGWRTLPLLIGRPGLLTRRYIDGQRTRYVSPLALFLFTVFLMFFVFSFTGGIAPSTHVTVAQRAQVNAELAQPIAEGKAEVARATAALAQARQAGAGIAAAQDDLAEAEANQRVLETTSRMVDATLKAAGSGAQTGTPGHDAADTWQARLAALDVHTGSAGLDAKLHHALGNPELFLYEFKNKGYKLSFMLIPISLPFLWLMFVGRPGVAVYDHAIFSLYSLSFMSLLFIAAAMMGAVGLGSLTALLVVCVPPLHMFLQLRETYGLGIFAALWRTAALLCVAGTAFVLFVVLILVLSLH
jgi:hypothetical protein